MKRWLEITLLVILIILLLFAALHFFLQVRGASLVKDYLHKSTGKSVSLGYFNVRPLLSFELSNLNIEGLARLERIYIEPSLFYLLTGRLGFNKIYIQSPSFTYIRTPPAVMEGLSMPIVPPETAEKPQDSAGSVFPLVIKSFKIHSGTFNFIDNTVGVQGLKITVKDINFSLIGLSLKSKSASTYFELEGRIPWDTEGAQGKISAEGWLNLYRKNMQATLKIEDINGIYFYPYYSNWVDLEKARIQSAKLNFLSEIQSLNNTLTADCKLELVDIVRTPRPEEAPQAKAEKITDVVLDIFKAMDQGKIALNFTIKTKMDDPKFGFGNIRDAFEDKLSKAANGKLGVDDVMALPGKMLEGTLRGVTGVTRALIEGTVTIGSELRKAVEDSFRKEKPEQREKQAPP